MVRNYSPIPLYRAVHAFLRTHPSNHRRTSVCGCRLCKLKRAYETASGDKAPDGPPKTRKTVRIYDGEL